VLPPPLFPIPLFDVALILDSLGGHKSLETAQNVQIILLPLGATGGYQPLDVYGFRIWRAFVRKISSEIRLLEDTVNITLGQRNSILKIQYTYYAHSALVTSIQCQHFE